MFLSFSKAKDKIPTWPPFDSALTSETGGEQLVDESHDVEKDFTAKSYSFKINK